MTHGMLLERKMINITIEERGDGFTSEPVPAFPEGKFFYDEFGEISYATGDADAQDTISKLRLDSTYLTQERSDEILHTLYDETGTMLTPDELELMYDRMMTKDKDGRYHNFHFVIASVIMRLI